jgi:hypothetical protein
MKDDKPSVMTREFLAERDSRMLKMRQAGMSVGDIAKRFGVSSSVVQKAINRQLEKLNRETMLAYPEVLRMELERLDSLQSSIWPLTQHRKVRLDDGSEVQVEPDLKAIQQVLLIMDRRAKLLGMDRNNLSIQMEVTTQDNIKSTLVGETPAAKMETFNPEAEAKALLELMGKSGIISSNIIGELISPKNDIVDAEVVDDVKSEAEADDHVQ